MPDDRRRGFLGNEVVSWEYRIRSGEPKDAAAIERWTDEPPFLSALKSAVDHLRRNDGECYIIERGRESAARVIGFILWSVSTLDGVYLEPNSRQAALAATALQALADRFFKKEGGQILANKTVTPMGEKVLELAGFELKSLGFGISQWTLTEKRWQSVAKLF